MSSKVAPKGLILFRIFHWSFSWSSFWSIWSHLRINLQKRPKNGQNCHFNTIRIRKYSRDALKLWLMAYLVQNFSLIIFLKSILVYLVPPTHKLAKTAEKSSKVKLQKKPSNWRKKIRQMQIKQTSSWTENPTNWTENPSNWTENPSNWTGNPSNWIKSPSKPVLV